MSNENSLDTVNGSTIYHYTPSSSLATGFCVAFGVSTALHIYQAVLTKSWYMLPIIIGGAFETIGYVGRLLGANEAPDYALAPYIVQAILILVAPTLIAASIYMVMGHIIHATDGEKHSMIRERVFTKLFVLGDITSFMVQSTGASMLTKKEQKQKDAGSYIIIGGLVTQLLFFGFFIITTIVFRSRLGRDKSRTPTIIQTGLKWRTHILVLLSCSMLIMVRSIFRVIEYVQGQNGYLLMHESFSYIFDAALMLLSIALLNVVHPSEISAFNKKCGGKVISWIVYGSKIHANAAGAVQGGSEVDEETAIKINDQDVRNSHPAQGLAA